MSFNGKDDGLRAVKVGPLSEREADIPPVAKEAREQATERAQEVDATDAVPELPKDLGVADTVDWVGGDRRRAQVALDHENKGGGARRTLVEQLERVLSNETGAGIASNEA